MAARLEELFDLQFQIGVERHIGAEEIAEATPPKNNKQVLEPLAESAAKRREWVRQSQNLVQPGQAQDETPRTLEVETEENHADLRKRKSSMSKSGKPL